MSSNSGCTPQKESQVSAEFSALENAQASLSDLISQLGSRLAPAMRNPHPPAKEDSEEDTTLVPMAGRIRGCCSTTNGHLLEIEEMLDRLEL